MCLSACRCGGLDLLVYIFDILLLGPAFCSPLVVYVRVRMFDLRTLVSGRSEVRTEGHRYIRYGRLDSSVEDYLFLGCVKLVLLH